LIIPYLSYFFNNKKIKKEYKILNKTKIVYVKQIEGIIEDDSLYWGDSIRVYFEEVLTSYSQIVLKSCLEVVE
jgi:hypothetical protein